MSVSEDKELERKYAKIAQEATDPLAKLQAALLRRGVNSISRFGKSFKIFDDDRSKSLDRDEFTKGMRDYNTGLNDSACRGFLHGKIASANREISTEIDELFRRFDKDGSGSLNFDEFLTGLRPTMNASRTAIVMKAFEKCDKTGDGVITVKDLKGVYNVRQHKKFQSGEWDEKRCLEEFLHNFDSKADPDNQVTKSEWLNYYSGLSASVDNDAHFDLIIRQAWKL